MGTAGYGGEVSSPASECVAQICPDRQLSYTVAFENLTTKANQPDLYFEKVLGPLILEAAKLELEHNVFTLKETLEWLPSATVEKNPLVIRLSILTDASEKAKRVTWKYENSNIVVDREKSKAQFPELSSQDLDKLSTRLEKLVGLQSLKPFKETDISSLLLRYEGDLLIKAIDKIFISLSANKKKLEDNPDAAFLRTFPMIQKMGDVEALRLQMSVSGLDQVFIEKLNSEVLTMEIIVKLISDPDFVKVFDGPEIDVKKYAKEKDLTKKITEIVAKRQAPLDPAAVTATCRAQYAKAYEFLPSENELEVFKNSGDKMKQMFIDKTKDLICPENRGKYINVVKAWKPIYPLTREKYQKIIKTELEKNLKAANESKSNAVKVMKSSFRDSAFSLSLSSLSETKTFYADDSCKSLEIEILPDAATFSGQGFIVGPWTVKNKNLVSITFHEMAHKLYKEAFSGDCKDKSFLQKVQSCLASQHTELSLEEQLGDSSALFFNKAPKYDSEDWADLIAAAVSGADQNLGCALIPRTVGSADHYSMKSSTKSDVHSSSFFRMLHFNFLKDGKIPESCEKALATKGEKPNFKNCLQVK